jgi:hypothetical protein
LVFFESFAVDGEDLLERFVAVMTLFVTWLVTPLLQRGC